MTDHGHTATARISTTAALLGAAGLTWAVAQAVLPDMGLATPDRYDAVAAAPSREALSAALFFAAATLLVLGSLSALRRLPDGRGHRPLAVGVRMLAVGGIWLAAGRGAFNLEFATLVDASLPRETAIQVLDASSGPAFVPLLLTLPCLLLGPILMAIGVHRAGLAGWLPLALWVVGIGTFVATEFVLKAAETAGIAVAALALALLGVALGRPATETSEQARGGQAIDVTGHVHQQA